MSRIRWSEVSRILYERLKYCRVNKVANELKYLREKGITSLKHLRRLPSDELQKFANFSEEGNVLSQEIRNIQLECKKKGGIFLVATESPYWNNPGRYNHWLPVDRSRLLGMGNSKLKSESDWDEILATHYKEFDTLCHDTHINAAATIFKENNLKSNIVQGNSVFSKVPGHPNKQTKVVWFSPASKASMPKMRSQYGDVALFMDRLAGHEGIMRKDGKNYWKYYFVEAIDYRVKSACRILATTKPYPHLTQYDPTKKGGPWYYDEEKGKHYSLHSITRWDGQRHPHSNSLEIMREEDSSKKRHGWFMKNLMFCPIAKHSKCIKHGYECPSKRVAYPALRTYIMYHKYQPVFKPSHGFTQGLLQSHDPTQELLQSMRRLEVTPRNCRKNRVIETWVEVQQLIKAKTMKKKITKEDVQRLYSSDDDLRKKVFLLFWSVAEEIVANRCSYDDIMKSMEGFPHFKTEIDACLESLE